VSESFPSQHAEKSPWSRRLAKGCVGVLLFVIVAIIVTNIVIKNFVANRLEEEFEKKGLKAKIGDFDYSIFRKQIIIKDFHAIPTASDDFKKYGKIKLDRGTITISSQRENGITELYLEGAEMKMGSVDTMNFVPEVLMEAKGLKFNNPVEFGGGSLLEFKEVKFDYAKSKADGGTHFRQVRIDIQRVNIVRNKKGLWLTDLMGEAQKKVQKMQDSKDSPAIDDLKITIAEISFQDLATNDPPIVLKVGKVITVNNTKNPRAYGLSVILQLAGIVYEAKKKSGF
jgi:hypothetical protein